MKVLVFDIWGDFGHFRKFFSTSSPLTYSIIPPTAMYGILGAILGFEKENNFYLEKLNHQTVRYGIKILKPVKKTRIGLNHINTKGNIWIPKQRREGPRTQIRTEFLKDPGYRCYIHITDENLFERLIEYVSQHKSVYTVSLGLSECLAQFQYVTIEEVHKTESNDYTEMATVLKHSMIQENGLLIEDGKTYMKETVATEMDVNRVVSNYEEIIFESTGKPIKVLVDHSYVTSQSEHICFIN